MIAPECQRFSSSQHPKHRYSQISTREPASNKHTYHRTSTKLQTDKQAQNVQNTNKQARYGQHANKHATSSNKQVIMAKKHTNKQAHIGEIACKQTNAPWPKGKPACKGFLPSHSCLFCPRHPACGSVSTT